MKNKILITILMFLISIIALGSLSYAYFAYQTTVDLATVSAAKPTYVTVNSEYEMHKAIYDPVDNASTSVSKNRYAIKLGGNIKLTSDMVITRDIALDLGIYKFDLNGYMLKILHTYEGKSVIKNETIGLDSGKFVNSNEENTAQIDISTPNIEIAYNISDLIEQDADIEILTFSEERLVEDVYQFVKSRMFGYYWHDLALPTHYYNYDIAFDYDFSVEVSQDEEDDFINNNGHILHLPLEKRNALMTLNISSPTLIDEVHDALTVPFILLPGKPSSTYYDERMAAAEKEFIAYLDYYRWGMVGNNYYVYSDLQLPNLDSYFGLTAVYSATSTFKAEDETTTTLLTGDLSTVNGHTTIHKYNLDTHDGQRTVNLKVDYTFDEGGTITIVTRTYKINIITDTNYDIASQILDSIGIVLVRQKVFALPSLEELEEYGIKNVTYAINSNYFEITGEDSNIISLVEENYPPITEKIYLSITFDFLTNEPLTITSQTRIYCESYGSGEGEEIYDQYFDAYYDLHSLLVSYLNNGLRVATFQMPSSTLSRNVTYGLIKTSELPQDVTSLSIHGYEQIEADNGDIIASVDNSPLGYSEIIINFDKIPLYDTNVTLLYCFNGTSWYGNNSSFTIPGVIRGDTIINPNLFEAVKQFYDANNDNILLTREATVALGEPFVVQNVAVSDWSGIELLINLTELEIINSTIDAIGMSKIAKLNRLRRLTINNCGVTNAALANIPKFDRLVYLNLAHNNITALNNLAVLPSLIELDVSYNQIENVSRLISFPSLQDINISNNRINFFEDLRNIANLKTVRLYNNIKPGDDGLLYGSLGSYNVTSFTVLYRTGIDVYYRLDGTTEVLFAPSNDQIRGVEILEAISYTSNGNGKIELTTTVFNSGGGVICYINYVGDDFNFTTPVNGKIYATLKPGLDIPGTTHYIVASTVVNSTTVYRVLEVVMP